MLFVRQMSEFLSRSCNIPRIVCANLTLHAIRNPNRLGRQHPQVAPTPDDPTRTIFADLNRIAEPF